MLNNSRQSLTLHRVAGAHAHEIRKVNRCEGEGWISCHRSKLWNMETREVWLSILHSRRRHGTDYGHDTLVDKVLSCKTEINKWIGYVCTNFWPVLKWYVLQSQCKFTQKQNRIQLNHFDNNVAIVTSYSMGSMSYFKVDESGYVVDKIQKNFPNFQSKLFV